MNIVYFIEDITESGGVERAITQKANALAAELRHNVTIISVYEPQGSVRYFVDESVRMENLGVRRARHGNVLTAMLEKVRIFAQSFCRMRRLLPALQPDVVFFVWVLGAMMLPFANVSCRRIFESHSSRANTPYKFFLRLMERKADTVVALTQGDARLYRHCKEVRVIPNFILLPEAKQVDYSVKRAIAVGRLLPVKGFDRLLRIWKESGAAQEGWQLDIYGIGPMREELEKQILSLRLHDSVRLCGTTSAIMQTYPSYSLHLMPSRAEGQGLVLIEAQACALPSISFDFDFGASDIITDGINGRLVPQDDERAFALALRELLLSPETRQRMGIAARLRSQRYGKQQILPLWQQLLSEER